MAAVSLFVDDAVRGRLPNVCVKTGQPADLTVRTTQAAGGGGLGLLWLLALAGPPGWLGLLLLALVLPGHDRLTVRLPYTRAAWDRERALVRLCWGFAALGLAALAAVLLRPGPFPSAWLAVGAGSLLAACGLWTFSYFERPGFALDASRRWVTLSTVHPRFVEAVEARQAAAAPR